MNRIARFALFLSLFFALPNVVAAPVPVPAPTQNWPGWMKMPLLSAQAKAAGVFPGGEGGQWPRGAVVVSASNPSFLLLPIDVGGVYRSLDGGAHWNLAMTGWNARGANGFAIDPRNARHVLGIGGNSSDWGQNWGPSPHGLYLSGDSAASWCQTAAILEGIGGALSFDVTSFDGKICRRAYFLSGHGALFQSEDGGASWNHVTGADTGNPDALSGHLLRVDGRGTLFVGGETGLWKSRDRGQSWKKLRAAAVFGLDVGRNGAIWASGSDKISVSHDEGDSFALLPCVGISAEGQPVRDIAVSPADANRLLCWVKGENYRWVRLVSGDGGRTFAPIKIERGTAARDDGAGTSKAGGLSFLPLNVRQGYFAWHPTNPKLAYGLGGDWVTRSTDGGRTFGWWNNGYNGIMLGASFNFAVQNPQNVLLSFQDYNAASTLDGGVTWKYHDVSGQGWGGFCYGAGQTSGGVMWCGDAQSWSAKRRLRISRDGGNNWRFAQTDGQNCTWDGPDISFTDPKNAATLFASNWRSTDRGASWAKMAGCDGVYISALDGTLIGKKGAAIVRSTDGGVGWESVVEVPGGFDDVAFDATRRRFYVASQERLKSWENGVWMEIALPRDQKSSPVRARTVAVDVGAPDVVYVGGPRDIYATHATIARSRDGAKSWENLSTGDGPHEVGWVRVHPQTGDAWVSGQCFGMWRLARPQVLGAADPSRGDAPPMPNLPLLTTAAR